MEVVSVTNPSVKWQVNHVRTTTSSTDSSGSSDSADETSSDDGSTSQQDQPLPPLATAMTPKPSKPGAVRKKNTVHASLTNPPEVQRVVVEHVIKSQSSNSKWMRTFSGKIPKPPGEADYETRSLHVELMFNDDRLSVDVQRRKILESLLPPASDVVRQLGTSAHPRHYVQLLDSAYGLVEDGEEVLPGS